MAWRPALLALCGVLCAASVAVSAPQNDATSAKVPGSAKTGEKFLNLVLGSPDTDADTPALTSKKDLPTPVDSGMAQQELAQEDLKALKRGSEKSPAKGEPDVTNLPDTPDESPSTTATSLIRSGKGSSEVLPGGTRWTPSKQTVGVKKECLAFLVEEAGSDLANGVYYKSRRGGTDKHPYATYTKSYHKLAEPTTSQRGAGLRVTSFMSLFSCIGGEPIWRLGDLSLSTCHALGQELYKMRYATGDAEGAQPLTAELDGHEQNRWSTVQGVKPSPKITCLMRKESLTTTSAVLAERLKGEPTGAKSEIDEMVASLKAKPPTPQDEVEAMVDAAVDAEVDSKLGALEKREADRFADLKAKIQYKMQASNADARKVLLAEQKQAVDSARAEATKLIMDHTTAIRNEIEAQQKRAVAMAATGMAAETERQGAEVKAALNKKIAVALDHQLKTLGEQEQGPLAAILSTITDKMAADRAFLNESLAASKAKQLAILRDEMEKVSKTNVGVAKQGVEAIAKDVVKFRDEVYETLGQAKGSMFHAHVKEIGKDITRVVKESHDKEVKRIHDRHEKHLKNAASRWETVRRDYASLKSDVWGTKPGAPKNKTDGCTGECAPYPFVQCNAGAGEEPVQGTDECGCKYFKGCQKKNVAPEDMTDGPKAPEEGSVQMSLPGDAAGAATGGVAAAQAPLPSQSKRLEQVMAAARKQTAEKSGKGAFVSGAAVKAEALNTAAPGTKATESALDTTIVETLDDFKAKETASGRR